MATGRSSRAESQSSIAYFERPELDSTPLSWAIEVQVLARCWLDTLPTSKTGAVEYAS